MQIAELNEIENKAKEQKINETKSYLFERPIRLANL